MKNHFFPSTLKIAFCLILAMMSHWAFAQVVYVTPEGAGLMNGSSWDNALAGNSPAGNGYSRLADTLRQANAGAYFWIKEGTYLPSTDNDREKSFQVPEGVSVYGGFAGNELTGEERDWNDHFSVLSGDIGVAGSDSDNTFHVVTTIGNESGEYIRLDGLTICNGNTTGAPYIYTSIYHFGGGILTGYKTRIYNCLVTNNTCVQIGGGVYATGITEIAGCTFTHNLADQGGAIGVSYLGTASINNCRISQNSALAYGGGVGNDGSCSITNCIIVNNGSLNGGGVLIRGGTAIANSTIANNTNDNIVFWMDSWGTIKNSVVSGGGISVWNGASMDCQFSCTDDAIPGEGNIRQNPLFVAPTPERGTGSNGMEADWHLRWCSPCLNMGNNNMIPNGITTDIDGNPRILYSTVDIGAYETDSSGSVHNVIGFNNSRICIFSNAQYVGSGGTWETALAGNGESCKYPGQSLLYEAMKDATSGTEIWVEKGTYKTSLYPDRNHAFTVGPGVKVYGGFLGNETLLAQRDPVTNKTIFSGNIGDTTTDADNAWHILNINPSGSAYADSAMIDGVVLEKARTEGTDAAAVLIHTGSKICISRTLVAGDTLLGSGVGFMIKSGARVTLTDGTAEKFARGGIYNEGKLRLGNFTVKSNLFSGIQNFDSLAMYACNIDSNSILPYNYDASGGAICNAGYCTITGGNIRGNMSYLDAGGIRNKPNAVMHITGCNISGNKCNAYVLASGGGILNDGYLEITQSSINYNDARAAGGGICNSQGATCTIAGSAISNNETMGPGGGIYNPTSVRNCIIVNNKGGNGYGLAGGGIYLATGCTGIINSTIMNNIGEGIASVLADTIEIGNSIIYGNDLSISGRFNASYSCITGLVPVNHNTPHNPQCISPSEGKGPGFDGVSANWGLWGCSPCVNAGSNAFLQAGDSVDAAGGSRVKWNVVDIGATELQTDSLSGDCPPGISHNIIWEIFKPKVDCVQSTTGAPDQSVYLPTLETEFSEDMNSVSRLRGYLIPPVSGYYRFCFSADPFASFNLSTDSSDINIRQIGGTDFNGNYQWPQNPVITDSVHLVQGKPYYFESFCQGYYWNNCCNPWIKTPMIGNYLKIGWVVPGTSNLSVIPWNCVRPAGPGTVRGVQWEIFENQATYDFDDLKNAAFVPDWVVRLDSLSTTNFSTTKDHFSSRIRGYLLAPATGDYTFYFACDNVGQFWLSSDTLPENAQMKSAITYCQPDWWQNTSVQSLVAGQRYFFEILHYDTVYTDLIQLGWKIPGDTVPRVIKYPFILNYNDGITVQSFTLLDHEFTAFPGWTVTPRHYLAPWNSPDKSIRWTSGNQSVATVNADGIITMVASGVCNIVARPASNPALSDTVRVTVTNYYGPYFVKQNAAGDGDGHSWESAIPLAKLLNGLNQGELNQQVKVFVAEGTYKPTTTIDQNKTFNLNHIRIVGGFPNSVTGNDTITRDYTNHETILSGEIGTPGETIDNSYHVVTTRNSCTINGFTIRDGRASCSSYGWTPGFSYFKREDNGGGIITEGCNLTIENCKLTNNSAWNSGGGLYSGGSNVKIENCQFYQNYTVSELIGTGGVFFLLINTYGAGISASSNTVINLANTTIFNNVAMGQAGAIFMQSSVVNLTNCSAKNNPGFGGYAFYAASGSTLNLNNSTVAGTIQYYSYPSGIVSNTTIDGNLLVANCFSKNAVSLDNSIITGFDSFTILPSSGNNLSDSVFSAKYCILGNSLFGASKEVLISDTVPDHTNWLDTLACNGGNTPTMKLRNLPGNPAKTSGNSAWISTTDQRGYTRTDTVSIGAYQWTWPSQITINPQQASIAPGDSLPFSVAVLPVWADDKTWSVSASDSTIVGIAANAMVAKSEGNARVMVRTNDGNRRDTCFVMVMTDSVGVNGIVHNGNYSCYSALDVISVAGNGTSFVMQPGSNSEMIAGEKIFYLPGTTVKAGGFMHGYIAPEGPWCSQAKISIAESGQNEANPEQDLRSRREAVKIWPNPTNGPVHVLLNLGDASTTAKIAVYNVFGQQVFTREMPANASVLINLGGLNPGLYVLTVTLPQRKDIIKIILK